MEVRDDRLVLVVSNEQEQNKLDKVLSKIQKFYKKLGYENDIDIVVDKKNDIQDAIQKELEDTLKDLKIVEEPPKEKEKKCWKEKPYCWESVHALLPISRSKLQRDCRGWAQMSRSL